MSATRFSIVLALISTVSFLLAGQVSADIERNHASGETEPAKATPVVESPTLLVADGSDASGDSAGTDSSDDSDEPDCD